MDNNQRKRILDKINSLVNLTDFNELCDACFNKNLLSARMIDNIQRLEPHQLLSDTADYDEDTIKMERHKKLFRKITERGPEAFEKLHRIFIELKYTDALNVLFDDDKGMISIRSRKNPNIPITVNQVVNEENITDIRSERQHSISAANDDNIITLHEYEGLIQPNKAIVVRMANNITIDAKNGTYPMESKDKRGIFFLVSSHEGHQDIDDDDQTLLSLFQQLGFKLYAYSNISFDQFYQLFEQLLESDQMNDIECFVMAFKLGGRINSNGLQVMTFNDGYVVKLEEIYRLINNRRCPQLRGKPKICIYPFRETPNRIQTDGVGQGGCFYQISTLSDVINCYITTEGYLNENYTRYIQTFCDIMAERAWNTNFEDILKIIQDNVYNLSINSSRLQVASYDNVGFNNKLYFNPGINF